jgi:hypothetical protein
MAFAGNSGFRRHCEVMMIVLLVLRLGSEASVEDEEDSAALNGKMFGGVLSRAETSAKED